MWSKVRSSLCFSVLVTFAGCHHSAVRILPDAGAEPDTSPPSCPECDEHAWCGGDEQTVLCTCRDGWQGDGRHCEDMDECAQGTDLCDRQHGSCTNTQGGYTCACAAGWSLARDGLTCLDGITALRLAVGPDNTCVVKEDGTVACWGDNDWGESTPPAGSYRALSIGDSHACGLRTDGTVNWQGVQGGQELTDHQQPTECPHQPGLSGQDTAQGQDEDQPDSRVPDGPAAAPPPRDPIPARATTTRRQRVGVHLVNLKPGFEREPWACIIPRYPKNAIGDQGQV
jgi:hypothetical protein